MAKKEKTTIRENDNSVVIERGDKKYEVYFDKPDFAVYCGSHKTGSFVSVEIPDAPNGSIKLEYYPIW